MAFPKYCYLAFTSVQLLLQINRKINQDRQNTLFFHVLMTKSDNETRERPQAWMNRDNIVYDERIDWFKKNTSGL